MLVLTRKPNQTIHIGEGVKITVTKIKGNTVQLGIEAPKEVSIVREELLERDRMLEQKSRQKAVSITTESEPPFDVSGLPVLSVVRPDATKAELGAAV